MSSADVRALQAAANRYAAIANFTPISIDGVVGDQTEGAVKAALVTISSYVQDEMGNADQLIITLDQKMITQSASGLATYLNQNADFLQLPKSSSSNVATNPGSHVPVTASIPGLPGGLPSWSQIPTGVKIGGGVVLALLAWWGVKSYRQRHLV